MSRCKNCGFHFEEENGWQEYCSMQCAMSFHAGRILTKADKDANNRKWKYWMEFWGNTKNHRLVRFAKPTKKPTIGKWVERKCNASTAKDKGHERIVTIQVNIGGLELHRPMTDSDRKQLKKQKKLGGFSHLIADDIWRRLPSEQRNYSLGWFPHD